MQRNWRIASAFPSTQRIPEQSIRSPITYRTAPSITPVAITKSCFSHFA